MLLAVVLLPLLVEVRLLLEAALVLGEAVPAQAAVELLDSMGLLDSTCWSGLSRSSRTCSVSLSKILPAAARKDLDMLKFAAAL